MQPETDSVSPLPGREPAWLSWVLAAALLLLAAAFAYPLFLGGLYVEDDLAAYHLPLRAFYHQALHEGHGFLWTPHIFNGYYLHGDGQIGMLHPWHWLLYRALPLQPAFMLELLANYAFLGLGMFLFLTRWKLPRATALFGAGLTVFVGFHINHYIDMAFIGVLAHLPWSLYCIDRAVVREQRHAKWFVLLGLLGGSQLLLGFPQGAYYAWLAEGCYALYLAWLRGAWLALAELVMVKILAAGLGMVQLLPTYDVMARSFRAQPGLDMQGSVSLHPFNFLGLVSPYLFHRRVYGPVKGDEPWDAPYMGALTMGLVILAVVRYRKLGHMRMLLAFGLFLTALGALSALGKYGPLIHLYAQLPLVSKFRAHARHLCLAHTGLAMAASVGFAHLCQACAHKTPMPWKHLAWLVLPPLLSMGVAAAVWAGRLSGGPWRESLVHFTMPPTHLLFGTALLLAASLLLILGGRAKRWALLGLVVLFTADAGLYSLRHKKQATLDEFRATVDVPESAAPGTRIDPDIHPMTLNRLILRDMRGVYGYVSFTPARVLDFTQHAPLRLASVRHRQARLCATPELNQAKLEGRNWLPFRPTVPYAWRAGEARVSLAPASVLEHIDPARVVLVDAPLREELSPDTGGSMTAVTRQAGGRIDILTEGDGQQLLTVSESYHPGWRVSIDGEPRTVHRAYGEFISVVAPPGRHEVRFQFDPSSFRLGLRISLACLALLLGYGFARHWAAKRGARTA